jgi:Primase X
MIRIPGSHNSKYILKGMDSQVRILQKWDGVRPSIKGEVLYEFYLWLAHKKIKDLQRQKESAKYRRKTITSDTYPGDASIRWIEKLLRTLIEDYRKNAFGLILAPYLITLKRLSYEDAFEILKEWLNKCASVRSLDFNLNYRIKYDLNNAMKRGIPPMKEDTLKQKNRLLYDKLCS